MVGDGADAEKAFLNVDYLQMLSGSQEMMHSSVNEFVNITDGLPAGRRGEKLLIGYSIYQAKFLPTSTRNMIASCVL